MEKILWWLLFIYLVAFPFGQLSRLPFLPNFPEIHLYLTDLLIGLIGVVWSIGWWKNNRSLPPFLKESSFFFIAAVFSLFISSPLFSSREVFVGSLYLLRVAAYGFLYIAVWDLVKKQKGQKLLLSSLVVVGVMLALFGWVQYFVYPNIKPFMDLGWDDHYKRIVGTFIDPSFTAIILVFTLILLSNFFLSIKKWNSQKILYGGMWLFSFVTLLFTYSRSGFLALIVGLGVVSFLKKVPYFFIVTVFLLGLGVMLLPRPPSEGAHLERTASVVARFESWENAVKIFQINPLFGVGFNMYRYAQSRCGFLSSENLRPTHSAAGTDSSLLFLLATTGVVGFIFFSWVAAKVVTAAIRYPSMEGTVFLASSASLAVHSLFLNSLFYPWVMGWMAILLGIFVAKMRMKP